MATPSDHGALGTLRVGAVTYLNSRPLTDALSQCLPGAEIVWDLPSRLADQLAAEMLDVALIPSFEFFRHRSYTIVSDACVACEGPVRSVKLFGRVPAKQVRTLALDEGSRTSAALAVILVEEETGRRPEIERLPIGASLDESQADAVLLIGDRAMIAPGRSAAFVWDLGQRWGERTGLPFVFSMWVARAGVAAAALHGRFAAARDRGTARLAEIARREAPRLGLAESECLDYLRNELRFSLGPREQRGLMLFCRKATEHRLLPAETRCEFHDCPAT